MQVYEAVEQAIAEEYVRLQGSTLQQLLEAAGVQSQALSASIDAISQQAYDAWQAAGNQAAHHLYVTLRVSQDRPLADVLAQPDVQAVLRRPFEYATTLTREAIEEAWTEGTAHGHGAANQDLGIMGLDPVGPVPIDQDALNQLLDDASANGEAAYQRFRDSIQSQDPDIVRDAIRHATQDQALRARSGADVAGKRASSDAKQATLAASAEDQGVTAYKVWVTSFSANTCGACAALHGTRLRVDQYFPGDATFGRPLPVWGTLYGPPRHPNCRCRLVPWPPESESEPGPTVRSMAEHARAWWASHQA